MELSKAEELYEQLVKPLPTSERLRLVELIARDLVAATHDLPHQRSLLELEGLGAEIWQGIDAQEYVNELRKEWDHRPCSNSTQS
jgi:hypothetical protein